MNITVGYICIYVYTPHSYVHTHVYAYTYICVYTHAWVYTYTYQTLIELKGEIAKSTSIAEAQHSSQ